jgi:PAS domain S-box-containing protein
MDIDLRPSGIDGLGDMSWGTHFCLFYENKEDLLDFFIPFFKAGLEHQQFCLCVASEPLIAEEAERAMRQAFPDFEQYLATGQIEITSHTDWYLKDGRFDEQRVLQDWIDKLNQALAKGFSGLRFAANILLEKRDWESFAQYEGKVDENLRGLQIEGLCAYSLNRYSAANVLDVMRHHQFTLARRDRTWEPLEGGALKHAHEEVLKLNAELEGRVKERTAQLEAANEQLTREVAERKQAEDHLRLVIDTIPAMVFTALPNGSVDFVNQRWLQFMGLSLQDVQGWGWDVTIHPEDRARSVDHWRSTMAAGQSADNELRVRRADGVYRWILGRFVPLRNEMGNIVKWYGVSTDIDDRKRAEEEMNRQAARAETLAHIAARLNKQLDLEAVIHAVCEEVINTFKVSQATMSLYDKKRDLLVYAGGVNIPPKYAATMEPITRSQFDDFLQAMGPVMVVPDIQSMPDVPNAEFSSHLDVRTVVTAAMLRDQELVGALAIGVNGHVREFDKDELTLLKAISDQAAQAIANARLFQTVSEHAARMEVLAEISRTFAEAGLDYQSILNTVARRTSELIGDSCVITLFSQDGQRAFPVAFHHPDPGARALMHEALLHTWQGGTDTQRYQTLLSGNSIFIPAVNPEEFRISLEPEFLPYLDAIGISSVLIVPLRLPRRVIGTLGLTRDRYGSSYTRDDQVLLQDVADRAALTIQNAQLFEQVQGAREQLEALSHRLLEVQEAERRALTMELHDRVGQNLTGLSINLQNMKALLSAEMAKRLATKFDDAQILVEDTARQIRDIMAELYLPELEDYGLAIALETYAERAASRGNLELITDLPDLAPPPLPSDVRIALFRAAQEAISNVLKHASATQLEVSLEERDGRIRLRVEDDGQGFDPNTVSQKEAQTWGLKIMRERVESIGGKVQIESEPGEGTRVTFEVERPS